MSKAWEGGSPHKKTSNITTYHLEMLRTEPIILPPIFTNTERFVDENHWSEGLVLSLKTYIATRKKGEKTIDFYPPRQSFWDYILGRKPKKYTVKIVAKDVLKNPPATRDNVIRIYEIDTIS